MTKLVVPWVMVLWVTSLQAAHAQADAGSSLRYFSADLYAEVLAGIEDGPAFRKELQVEIAERIIDTFNSAGARSVLAAWPGWDLDHLVRSVVSADGALDALGTDVAKGVVEGVMVGVLADRATEMLFSTPPMTNIDPVLDAPLRAAVRAGIVEIYDLQKAGRDPTVLLGKVLDRAHDAIEIYQATALLAQVERRALVATALNLASAAEIGVAIGGESGDKLITAARRDIAASTKGAVGRDDAEAVESIFEHALEALVAHHRSDPVAARAAYLQAVAGVRRGGNINPFSAIVNPLDWGVAAINWGKDSPAVALEILFTTTAFGELRPAVASSAPPPILSSSLAEGQAYGSYRERFTAADVERIIAAADQPSDLVKEKLAAAIAFAAGLQLSELPKWLLKTYEARRATPIGNETPDALADAAAALSAFAKEVKLDIEDLRLFSDARNIHQMGQHTAIPIMTDVAGQAGWRLLPLEKAGLHMAGYTRSDIRKYAHENGCEYVFARTTDGWVFLNDGRNTGTFNYASDETPVAHVILDMLPWIVWGVGPQERGGVSDRLAVSGMTAKVVAMEFIDKLRPGYRGQAAPEANQTRIGSACPGVAGYTAGQVASTPRANETVSETAERDDVNSQFIQAFSAYLGAAAKPEAERRAIYASVAATFVRILADHPKTAQAQAIARRNVPGIDFALLDTSSDDAGSTVPVAGDIEVPPPSAVGGDAWSLSHVPDIDWPAGTFEAELSFKADGSFLLGRVPILPAAPSGADVRLHLYSFPASNVRLAIQHEIDLGGIRGAIVDFNPARVVATLVPEAAVWRQAQPENVRFVRGPVAWSPDGRLAAMRLVTAEWEADLLIVELQSGAVTIVSPDDMGADRWASPVMASLRSEPGGWVSADFDVLVCADTQCTASSRVGDVTVHRKLTSDPGDPASPVVSPQAKTSVWGPEIVVPTDHPVRGFEWYNAHPESDAEMFVMAGVPGPAMAFHAAYENGRSDVLATEFIELGVVDLVRVEPGRYPGTSDRFRHPAYVNGQIGMMLAESGPRNLAAAFRDATSRAVLARHPDAWGTTVGVNHRRLPNGGQRFVENASIVGSCRVCPEVGSAISFVDFNKSGAFLSRRPIGIVGPQAAASFDGTGRGWAAVNFAADMTDLQYRLNMLGYEAGAMDGFAGPQTRQALMEFQIEHCLAPTGQPDDDTRQALSGASGISAPCSGAALPAGISANAPLQAGLYVTDLGQCDLDPMPWELLWTQVNIDGQDFRLGHENSCTVSRSDIRDGVTRFRGDCGFADQSQQTDWRFDIISTTEFVFFDAPIDTPTVDSQTADRRYTLCGQPKGNTELANDLPITASDSLYGCTPTGAPNFPQALLPVEDSSTHSGRTRSGNNWTLQLFSPGLEFGDAAFTNSSRTTVKGFWRNTATGICQSYDGRESWSCFDVLACEGETDRFAMRNAVGEISSVIQASTGPSFEMASSISHPFADRAADASLVAGDGHREHAREDPVRVAILSAVRPVAEEIFGAPVEFNGVEMRVNGDRAYADAFTQRPGGGLIDLLVTPGFARGEVHPSDANPNKVSALLRRDVDGNWIVERHVIAATEAFWLDDCATWGKLFPETCGMETATATAATSAPGSALRLVNFWASWCVPCQLDKSMLSRAANDGIEIEGVMFRDDPTAAVSYLTEFSQIYSRTFSDTNGVLSARYGVTAVPVTLVVDNQDRVVARVDGPLTEENYRNIVLAAWSSETERNSSNTAQTLRSDSPNTVSAVSTGVATVLTTPETIPPATAALASDSLRLAEASAVQVAALLRSAGVTQANTRLEGGAAEAEIEAFVARYKAETPEVETPDLPAYAGGYDQTTGSLRVCVKNDLLFSATSFDDMAWGPQMGVLKVELPYITAFGRLPQICNLSNLSAVSALEALHGTGQMDRFDPAGAKQVGLALQIDPRAAQRLLDASELGTLRVGYTCRMDFREQVGTVPAPYDHRKIGTCVMSAMNLAIVDYAARIIERIGFRPGPNGVVAESGFVREAIVDRRGVAESGPLAPPDRAPRSFVTTETGEAAVRRVVEGLVGGPAEVILGYRNAFPFKSEPSKVLAVAVFGALPQEEVATVAGTEAGYGSFTLKSWSTLNRHYFIDDPEPGLASAIVGQTEDLRILSVRELVGSSCEWSVTYRIWLTEQTPFGKALSAISEVDGLTFTTCFRTTRNGYDIVSQTYVD